jgi:hypothetical protein
MGDMMVRQVVIFVVAWMVAFTAQAAVTSLKSSNRDGATVGSSRPTHPPVALSAQPGEDQFNDEDDDGSDDPVEFVSTTGLLLDQESVTIPTATKLIGVGLSFVRQTERGPPAQAAKLAVASPPPVVSSTLFGHLNRHPTERKLCV